MHLYIIVIISICCRLNALAVEGARPSESKPLPGNTSIGEGAAQLDLGLQLIKVAHSSNELMQAIGWLKIAALQKNATAQLKLGYLYAENIAIRNPDEAFLWFKMAADQNLIEAQLELGMCYLNGWGITRSKKDALSQFLTAANAGSTEAKFQAALLLFESNPAKATILVRQSAEDGYWPGQVKLANLLYYGIGIKKDKIEGYKWMIIVCASKKDSTTGEIKSRFEKELSQAQMVEGIDRARITIRKIRASLANH